MVPLDEFAIAKQAIALKARCDEVGLTVEFSRDSFLVGLPAKPDVNVLKQAASLAEALAFVDGYRYGRVFGQRT